MLRGDLTLECSQQALELRLQAAAARKLTAKTMERWNYPMDTLVTVSTTDGPYQLGYVQIPSNCNLKGAGNSSLSLPLDSVCSVCLVEPRMFRVPLLKPLLFVPLATPYVLVNLPPPVLCDLRVCFSDLPVCSVTFLYASLTFLYAL